MDWRWRYFVTVTKNNFGAILLSSAGLVRRADTIWVLHYERNRTGRRSYASWRLKWHTTSNSSGVSREEAGHAEDNDRATV